MENKFKVFSIILMVIPLGVCLFFAWQLSGVKQEINDIQTRLKLTNQIESIPINTTAKISNKQVIALQYQITKIQDFEDRRYNAITTQLNSFWSGINGFLALIGIFFAMFSWYLTKEVEASTKNIEVLEKSKKEIDDYILDKSSAIYDKTMAQDNSRLIKSIMQSDDHGLIVRLYEKLSIQREYLDMEDIIEAYKVFNRKHSDLKVKSPAEYYYALDCYLTLMIDKDLEKIPDGLIQELINTLIIGQPWKSAYEDPLRGFSRSRSLCKYDQRLAKRFSDRFERVISIQNLYKGMHANKNNRSWANPKNHRDTIDTSAIDQLIKDWFNYAALTD